MPCWGLGDRIERPSPEAAGVAEPQGAQDWCFEGEPKHMPAPIPDVCVLAAPEYAIPMSLHPFMPNGMGCAPSPVVLSITSFNVRVGIGIL